MDKEHLLMEKIDKNYSDYVDSMMVRSKQALVDIAGQIANVQDVYQYITEQHEFTDAELDCLLQLRELLMIIADRWSERDAHMDDIGDIIADVIENQQAGGKYACVEPRKDEQNKVAGMHGSAISEKKAAPAKSAKDGDAR